MTVRVQREDFDPGAEVAGLARGRTDVGAVVSFTGLVRDRGDGLTALELEHYPGMTERALAAIEADACSRWPIDACLVIHRFGRFSPGDRIVLVATAAAHRQPAFAAAEFVMDYLKSRAPFWKKETRAGRETWVEARYEDEDALDRWT
ncbi:MAG: molybdenum cofactor biosynthesis protein MoaE [Amaricoccus sp.]